MRGKSKIYIAAMIATALLAIVSAPVYAFDQANLNRLLSERACAGCDLRHAPLARSNLSGTDLSGADCSAANFSGANLSGADLSDANLSGAILSNADLSGANLTGANVSGAIWSDGTTRCSYRSLGTCTGLKY